MVCWVQWMESEEVDKGIAEHTRSLSVVMPNLNMVPHVTSLFTPYLYTLACSWLFAIMGNTKMSKELTIHFLSTQSRSFQTQIDTIKKISRGPTVFKITTHHTKINESFFSRHNSILYKETALKTRKNKSPDLQTKSCQSSQGVGNKDLYSQFVSEHGL